MLNVALIPRAIALFGEGGGGAGCAFAMLGTELFVTTAMASIVGLRSIDRRTLETVAKSLGACAIVVGVDRITTWMGPLRLVVDASVYLGIVVATGALRTREIADVIVEAFRRKAATIAPAVASEDR